MSGFFGGLVSSPILVGFLVTGQVSLQVLRPHPDSIIPSLLLSIYVPYKGPGRGRTSSETEPHPPPQYREITTQRSRIWKRVGGARIFNSGDTNVIT